MSIRGRKKKKPGNLDIQAVMPAVSRKVVEQAYEDLAGYANAAHLAPDRAP